MFTPVLEAGCTLPCRSTQHFSTAVDDQTEIMLSLYRGVSERSSENDHLGRFVIRDIALCQKVSRRLMSSSRRASTESRFAYMIQVALRAPGSFALRTDVCGRRPGRDGARRGACWPPMCPPPISLRLRRQRPGAGCGPALDSCRPCASFPAHPGDRHAAGRNRHRRQWHRAGSLRRRAGLLRQRRGPG
ncbi:MAG: Hsp70 family protein [Xanthomonadales bacterium]|nr:Hsp70 family protein [Xanthomonadales bacterium]